jgi:Uma2 family endonuclease
LPASWPRSHSGAGLSTEPDGCFVSYAALERKVVSWVKGAEEGFVEIEGTPDMTLEIVSPASIAKDREELRSLYWQAGVAEYWLVDARSELSFAILKRTATGYSSTRHNPEGWIRSNIFQRGFRLVPGKDRLGNPRFTLEVR